MILNLYFMSRFVVLLIIYTHFAISALKIHIPNSFRQLCSMTSEKLAAVPDVDIDPEGTFKYVLIRVYGPEGPDGQEPSKLIVRGYSRAPFHSDVYDEVTDRLKGLGLDTECTGGGRIQHNPKEKSIKIYGYSQGFGRADHVKSAELVKVAFPDYDVTWTNDGY